MFTLTSLKRPPSPAPLVRHLFFPLVPFPPFLKNESKPIHTALLSPLLGSALFLGPDLYGYMKQAGIYEEFFARSKQCNSIVNFGENRKQEFVIDFTPYSEM